MKTSRNISLNYFTGLIAGIEGNNHIELEDLKEKLKHAYISDKPFLIELNNNNIFEYFDKYFIRERKPRVSSCMPFGKPVSELYKNFERLSQY